MTALGNLLNHQAGSGDHPDTSPVRPDLPSTRPSQGAAYGPRLSGQAAGEPACGAIPDPPPLETRAPCPAGATGSPRRRRDAWTPAVSARYAAPAPGPARKPASRPATAVRTGTREIHALNRTAPAALMAAVPQGRRL
jgi:hypothetical protein